MPEPKYADRNYRTLKDVALAVGVTRQRVSQVVKQHQCTLTQAAKILRENAKRREKGIRRYVCSACGESGHYKRTCER